MCTSSTASPASSLTRLEVLLAAGSIPLLYGSFRKSMEPHKYVLASWCEHRPATRAARNGRFTLIPTQTFVVAVFVCEESLGSGFARTLQIWLYMTIHSSNRKCTLRQRSQVIIMSSLVDWNTQVSMRFLRHSMTRPKTSRATTTPPPTAMPAMAPAGRAQVMRTIAAPHAHTQAHHNTRNKRNTRPLTQPCCPYLWRVRPSSCTCSLSTAVRPDRPLASARSCPSRACTCPARPPSRPRR